MRIAPVTFVLLALTATPAAAQLTPEQARAKTEQMRVEVVVADGMWKGRLVDIDAEKVTIEPRGGPVKTLPLAGVLRIEAKKRDSPVEGALVGGLVMTLWCLYACAQGAPTTADVPGIVMGGAMFGAVVGAIIDWRHMSTVSLYKRPPAAAPRKSSGVFFTVRF